MATENCPAAVRLLGIIGIIIGTTSILMGIGTMLGAFSQIPQDPKGLYVFITIVARYIILGVVSIVLAGGLIEGKRWAWFGALALSMIAFLKFPMGTLIGIFIISCLFGVRAREFFRIGASGPPSAT